MNAVETMQVELTREPVRDVAAFSTWRLMVCQVRRELWEHKSLWIAPLATAALVLAMWVWAMVHGAMRGNATLLREIGLWEVWQYVGILMWIVSTFTALQFCLDALYGERRERTVLFWKSMPISDGVTVASKFVVPMVVVPLIALAVSFVLDLLIWISALLIMLASHVDTASTVHCGLLFVVLNSFYGAFVFSFWYAPIYAALLLISSLSKKMPMTWAVVVPTVVVVMEKEIWRTNNVGQFLGWAFLGVFDLAWGVSSEGIPGFNADLHYPMTPERFFVSPHLWIGLLVAAVMLFTAARIRRTQVAG